MMTFRNLSLTAVEQRIVPLVVSGGGALLLMAMLALAPQKAQAVGCPIDLTSGQLQFGSASGQLAFPISAPLDCGTTPQSTSASAGPLGGTYWNGAGHSDIAGLSSDYTFYLGSGWWGWTPASMGTIFIPDLIISGGPDATVSASVNVAFGGTASGYIPPSKDVSWEVWAFDAGGNAIASSNHQTSYTVNAPTATATSGLLNNLPVGVAFGLELRAQWTPTTSAGVTTTGHDYLSFLAAAVLNLPEGYTLNAGSVGIVDNVYTAALPISAVVDIEPTIIHPHHDGRLGPQAIASLPDDPIPVVVFGASTAAGDPANLNTDNIDPATLAFGPGGGGVSPSHPPVFNLDEDSDGIDDARFTFLMSDAAFDSVSCTDSSGTLAGELTTGAAFEGADTFTSDCGAVCHN